MKVASKACAVIFLGLVVSALTSAEREIRADTSKYEVSYDPSSSPNPRAGDVFDKFELDMDSSGPKSRLFSKCQALANTFEGSLYSVTISENIEYHRFAPLQSRAIEWTKLTIDGDTGVLACILKAAELMAWMVKYEGKCLATFSDVYNSTEEQSCDNPQEVVYVIKGFNTFMNARVPFFEYNDCYKSLPTGMVFPDSFIMPPLRNCCAYLDDHKNCYDFPTNVSSFCQAKLHCQALGLTLANHELYVDLSEDWRILDTLNPLWDDPAMKFGRYLAIDYSRGKDGVWRWPGGEEESFPWGVQPEDYHDCALVLFTEGELLVPVRCSDSIERALCMETQSAKQQCPTGF
ncbi:uncharacterized protein LOC108666183 [Hyalella azteca]|uniref:Uncharacterized protein LOC108666183 n=1 Tax=Hyalella azteca TaxID=294128 RepID=A0A8B7N3R6_HYAAZ|nr:uncharacterized protein LOC108666183 [Hyalella azteca]